MITHSYDDASRRTQTSYSTSDPNVSYTYDGLGRMTQATRSNGLATDYDYGALSRLSELEQVGMTTGSFTYNPASQIATRSISNSAYTWNLTVDLTQSSAPNEPY